ncbi:protein kinase family protein [Aspergillus lucknowensis]|uniref:Kinase-like domain-containing protein n=1 Tax=Aspergillus lucknowensis TaxID=176173 RepID=A0ABR4LRS6_9EURO
MQSTNLAQEVFRIADDFSARLERLQARNWEARPFYRNGSVRFFFQTNRESVVAFFEPLLRLHDLSDLDAKRVSDLAIQHLCSVFAIVLRIRPREDLTILRQFTELLVVNRAIADTPRLTDENLPISLVNSQLYFSQGAGSFFDTQFQFCAITLQMNGPNYRDDYRSQCPLPYLSQEKIGGGAFGQVYKVLIERGHLRSTEESSGNHEPVFRARKDFKRDQAFSVELDVLRSIMAQPQKHDHLVMVHAILQYGDTSSLFFPLASCDLHQYLNGEYSTNVSAPTTLEQKSAVYRRGVDLAGALAFLHGSSGGVVCLHLDLKPRNVLVYYAGDPEKEIWKITDFGLTRVKNQEHSTAAPEVEGVYLPPECGMSNGRVATKSDVWSFGCIFSLVITYIAKGPEGVKRFANRRGERSEGDFFYVASGNSPPRISSGVTAWFDDLRSSAAGDERETRVIRESLDYLQHDVLHPTREKRASARDVEAALKEIHTHFFSQNNPPPSLSSSHSPPQHSTIPGRFRSWPWRRLSEAPVSRLRNFGYDLGTNGLGFRFSQFGGDFLAFFSAHRILIWTVSEILSAPANASQIPPLQSLEIPNESVKHFAVSSNSICAAVDGDSFKCYLYNVDRPSAAVRVDDGVGVSYDHMGGIKRVSMSLDGALVAFVITQRPGRPESGCKIYLASSRHLIDTADGVGTSYSLPRSSRSNSEVSESSFLSVPMAQNIILEHVEVGSATKIRFLDFTPDGKFLVIIIQNSTSGLLIRAWETSSGRKYCRDFSITNESTQNLRSLFTACVLYTSRLAEPCLTIITDGRRILHVNLLKRTSSSRELGKDVDSMFVSDDGQSLALIGRNAGLRVYLLPLHAPGTSDFTSTSKIDRISYSAALDAAALKRDGNQQLKLLIASFSGSFLEMEI